MELIKKLKRDWGYPVCQHPKELRHNILMIDELEVFKDDVQLVGIGTSGAMLLGALSYHFGWSNDNINYVLLRKDRDDTAKGRHHVQFKGSPIVIIDDHICYGNTLCTIADQLVRKRVSEQVIGVIAMAWNNDEELYIKNTTELMVKLFPSIQFWVH